MHRDRNALSAVMGATACVTVVVVLLVGLVAPAGHDTTNPTSNSRTEQCVTTNTNPSRTTTTGPCVTTNPSSTTTTKP
jgi:hypothetical protein